ncbi:MAG: pyridoxal-5'-phosphate-dependent protein [Kangiella sp.]|nr:MAG: pyridoxal-5'-phosphate-dependent protein [Kangiella sp.]
MIDYKQVLEAAKRIESRVVKTPVIQSDKLNQILGAEIFFKCENLQKIGAFKYRGACNSISQLSEQQKRQGIIAYSSGNHAQAVALVAKEQDIKATIVMPNNAPKIKIESTKAHGAKVILFNPQETTREQIAEQVNSDQALTLIKPFDNEMVIVGQGTAALELLKEVGDLDYILAPCGGGGLLSGTGIIAKHLNPDIKVIGVEPELADDAARSFYTGELHSNPNPPTIADGTRTTSMGDFTFPLVRQYVDEIVTVSEDSIKKAVAFAFNHLKIVLEPSGALPIAALMYDIASINLEKKSGIGLQEFKPQGRIGAILSGGNIDSQLMTEILDFSE